jgi:uncharacterized protein (TIRG00374 family)
MERYIGILATLLLALGTLPLVFSNIEFPGWAALILLPGAGVLAFSTCLFLIRAENLHRLMPKNQYINKIWLKFKEIIGLVRSFRKHKQALLKAMLLSILFNLVASLNVYVVAGALDIDVSLPHLFILVPTILLISAIPLSVNAIGIAEGAYVFCLGFAGLGPPEALSIALLMRAKTLFVSLLGGLFFLAHRRKHDLELDKEKQ